MIEEERIYCIYKHTSPSGKSYVGQTNNYEYRCKQHQAKDDCPAFHNAILKYNWENFIHEILEENLTIDEANDKEIYYIDFHGTLSPNGYNLTTGGLNASKSEETKKRMSEAATGKIFTEDHCRKLSEAKSGKNHPNWGKVRSKETCKKISESNIGKIFTDDHCKKISESRKGTTASEETLIKLREINGGENNSQYGKFGEDHPASKKYIVIHPDGREEYIIGLVQFCKVYNLNPCNMTNVLRGRQKTCKRFKCRYATEQEILDNTITV